MTFLLMTKRDKAVAMRFFDKAMKTNRAPKKVTMDNSSTNRAVMDEINAQGKARTVIRQVSISTTLWSGTIGPLKESLSRSSTTNRFGLLLEQRMQDDSSGKQRRNRPGSMSLSEMTTIVVLFYTMRGRQFKAFY